METPEILLGQQQRKCKKKFCFFTFFHYLRFSFIQKCAFFLFKTAHRMPGSGYQMSPSPILPMGPVLTADQTRMAQQQQALRMPYNHHTPMMPLQPPPQMPPPGLSQPMQMQRMNTHALIAPPFPAQFTSPQPQQIYPQPSRLPPPSFPQIMPHPTTFPPPLLQSKKVP